MKLQYVISNARHACGFVFHNGKGDPYPKQEIIRQSFGMEKQESGEIEIFDNIWLSSFEHGYFVAGADHTLTLNVTQHFEDMFNS